MSKKNKTRALYAEARRFLNLKMLFPKKIPSANNISEYQAKKMRAALREFHAATAAFGDRGDFIRLRPSKGLILHNQKTGAPIYSAGVFVRGGAKTNKNVTVRGGALHYTRGDAEKGTKFAIYPVSLKNRDAIAPQVQGLIPTIRKYKKSQLSSFGSVVGYGLKFNNNFEGVSDENLADEMLEEIYYLHDQYLTLFETGKNRPREGRGKASNPALWNFGIICHN